VNDSGGLAFPAIAGLPRFAMSGSLFGSTIIPEPETASRLSFELPL